MNCEICGEYWSAYELSQMDENVGCPMCNDDPDCNQDTYIDYIALDAD